LYPNLEIGEAGKPVHESKRKLKYSNEDSHKYLIWLQNSNPFPKDLHNELGKLISQTTQDNFYPQSKLRMIQKEERYISSVERTRLKKEAEITFKKTIESIK
jgi:hypothetical protein